MRMRFRRRRATKARRSPGDQAAGPYPDDQVASLLPGLALLRDSRLAGGGDEGGEVLQSLIIPGLAVKIIAGAVKRGQQRHV